VSTSDAVMSTCGYEFLTALVAARAAAFEPPQFPSAGSLLSGTHQMKVRVHSVEEQTPKDVIPGSYIILYVIGRSHRTCRVTRCPISVNSS